MEKFISTPQAGWSSLNLPEYHGSLSYIDDIPMMLCQLIEQYKTTHAAACSFDCEGYSFLLILSEYSIDILEFKESEVPTPFHSQIDPDQFCKQVLEELSNDIQPWVNTYYYQKEEPMEWKSYYRQLKKELNKCKQLCK